MLRILESQAPAKQTATDTINVLSSRIQNATLLEDRRAAILGLRSFASQYPASVASGALRSLISSLQKDAEDVDTLKVVLETLLMLFNPDENSPEASDEVQLWLADEFTQRQDNITVLLDLLDARDFYSRLYSLQLISAISKARPQRTQECIFTAPLGISRLVAVLDDSREAIRNEGLFLLTAITPSSPELQKLVAFENAFDRIFSMIDTEGSLTHGGMIVEDCLSLLANLLALNPSNQLHFRETGCVSKLAKLLEDAARQEASPDGVQDWAKPQRDKNLWGLLAIIRLFLVKGGRTTQANQVSFWRSGVLDQTLHLGFSTSSNITIRSEALMTCADLTRGNTPLQRQFAGLFVPTASSSAHDPSINGAENSDNNVISLLLQLVLNPAPHNMLDLRLSALECMKAYLYYDPEIRTHFLQRAIDGLSRENDHLPNFLSILMNGSGIGNLADPYQSWMAAVLFLHLIFDDVNMKEMAKALSEGDADSGEEVVTCLQAIASSLITGMQHGADERISVGYIMLLTIWMFEEPDVVNDFLMEGSIVESLIQATNQLNPTTPLVPGLCAVLLGVAYEFSTKDSPLPRSTLHKLLLTRLGREQYIDKITRLREHPLVRDFEVIPQGMNSEHALPDVYFDKTFIDFLKDNFSRLLRAIDRDPGMEIPVLANGVQKGISRELVDELKAKVVAGEQALELAQANILQLETQLSQEQADRRKVEQQSISEMGKIRQINQVLQKNHEDELRKFEQRTRLERDNLVKGHQQQIQELQNQMLKLRKDADNEIQRLTRESSDKLQKLTKEADDRAQRAYERSESEMVYLRNANKQLEADLSKLKREHLQDLQTADEESAAKVVAVQEQLRLAEQRTEGAEESMHIFERKANDAESRCTKMEGDVAAEKELRKAAQTELEDLMIVLADLEEKKGGYKKRLKALGEDVSDAEDEDEDDEEGSSEEEGNDDEADD
ncbi:MAG: hypothetical protein M1834_000852 [Cirrosporium novae-zelandiae]|nr:MAG: hypothetical protein M1834_000852 [Cirrosporium novae-zelandiae]